MSPKLSLSGITQTKEMTMMGRWVLASAVMGSGRSNGRALRIVVAGLVLFVGGTACDPVAGMATPSTTTGGPSGDMLNPAVTQATIRATICLQAGYTASIRPPATYTEALKRHQIATYGYADRRLGSYEEDHVVSLELGGEARAAANLFPEPHSVSSADDVVENNLHSRVCAGTLSLADARARIFAAKVTHGYDRAKSTS